MGFDMVGWPGRLTRRTKTASLLGKLGMLAQEGGGNREEELGKTTFSICSAAPSAPSVSCQVVVSKS
jgi:hypothetical protein